MAAGALSKGTDEGREVDVPVPQAVGDDENGRCHKLEEGDLHPDHRTARKNCRIDDQIEWEPH